MKRILLIFTLAFAGIYAFGQGSGNIQRTTDPGAFTPTVDESWKWINTTTGAHFIYNGTSWVEITATDDQNISGSGLAGTILTIGIENGSNETVDLASLQDGTGTDDQNITGSSFTSGTGDLVIGIENGTNQTVNLDGRYLQAEVDGSVTNEGSLTVGAGLSSTSIISSNTSGSTDVTLEAGTNITLAETGNTITITATGDGTGTDDQNISGSSFTSGTGDLVIGIENGTNETVNLDGRYLQSEVDGSITNEGDLTVLAGTASTSIISSNTSGSTDVTITAGSNITISETGNNITLAATQDGNDTSVLTDNGNETYTHDDGTGTTVTFDAFHVSSAAVNASGQVILTLNNGTTVQVTGWDNIPQYDTKSAAETARAVGEFWMASSTNTIGENQGTLHVSLN